MERFNKLSSVLRYVGLNLNPAILEVVITLDEKLTKNKALTLEEIDAVVAAIDAKNQPAEQPQVAPAEGKKLVKA